MVIEDYLKENISRLIVEKSRAPLFFDYMDENGTKNAILNTKCLTDLAEITDTVFWYPQVIGGNTTVQIFANHAYSIIANLEYIGWSEIEKGNLAKGIKTVAPDPDCNLRTWKIIPTANYPNTPPIVFAEPEFTNDVCFITGMLDYTFFTNKPGSPWLETVKKYNNPLIPLLNELMQKYIMQLYKPCI